MSVLILLNSQFNKTNVVECVYYTDFRQIWIFFYIIRTIWKLYFTRKTLFFLTKQKIRKYIQIALV